MSSITAQRLLRRGLMLEYATLLSNVIGTVVVIAAALSAGSVALAGFGLDSLIEIGASTMVIWQLNDTTGTHEQHALRVIGIAFIALAIYIGAPAAYTLLAASRPRHSTLGIGWTAVTCAVMLAPRVRQGSDRPRARQLRSADRRTRHPRRCLPRCRDPARTGAQQRPRLVVG